MSGSDSERPLGTRAPHAVVPGSADFIELAPDESTVSKSFTYSFATLLGGWAFVAATLKVIEGWQGDIRSWSWVAILPVGALLEVFCITNAVHSIIKTLAVRPVIAVQNGAAAVGTPVLLHCKLAGKATALPSTLKVGLRLNREESYAAGDSRYSETELLFSDELLDVSPGSSNETWTVSGYIPADAKPSSLCHIDGKTISLIWRVWVMIDLPFLRGAETTFTLRVLPASDSN